MQTHTHTPTHIQRNVYCVGETGTTHVVAITTKFNKAACLQCL